MHELAAKALDCALDVAQGLCRLRVRIAHTNDAAIGACGGRSGDEDMIADTNSTRIADDRFPRRARGKKFSAHGVNDQGWMEKLNRTFDNANPVAVKTRQLDRLGVKLDRVRSGSLRCPRHINAI